MSLRERFEAMSPREQKLLRAFGGLCAAFVFIGFPVYLTSALSSARERNADIRKVLAQLDKSGELLAERKGEREARELRFARPAPALASFIESAARENGLEVPESTDRPNTTGKGYTERATVVKMRKVGLKPLVQMLEKIERSKHPVAITMLSIKTRASAPDEYDVQLAVSAYDKDGAGKKAEDKGAKKGNAAPIPKGKKADGKGEEL